MKKSFSITILLAVIMTTFLVIPASASTCNLDATLLNQDPYPAIPGENVKVVIQITGVNDPTCGKVTATFLSQYPFSLDPSTPAKVSAQAGTFISNKYATYMLVPYEIRVDENAVDGENTIKIEIYNEGKGSAIIKEFDLEVKDVLTDFEVIVRDYDQTTKTLSFDVINIGENDIEALTIRVPAQEIVTFGAGKTNVIGLLDSGEDISTTFNNMEVNEGNLQVQISYNDETGTRRELTKNVVFNPTDFEEFNQEEGRSTSFYILVLIIVGAAVYWFYNRRKKKKNRNKN